MPDRWCLLPATGSGTGTDAYRPKYSDDSGIDGFSGTIVGTDVLNDYYAAILQQNPAVQKWYICRLYGKYTALQEISAKADTVTVSLVAEEVAPILDQHFPDLDVPEEKWSDRFKIG